MGWNPSLRRAGRVRHMSGPCVPPCHLLSFTYLCRHCPCLPHCSSLYPYNSFSPPHSSSTLNALEASLGPALVQPLSFALMAVGLPLPRLHPLPVFFTFPLLSVWHRSPSLSVRKRSSLYVPKRSHLRSQRCSTTILPPSYASPATSVTISTSQPMHAINTKSTHMTSSS